MDQNDATSGRSKGSAGRGTSKPKGRPKKKDEAPRPTPGTPDDPGERTLTTRQALYFAERSGVAADSLVGARVADVADRLRLHIDPTLWFFQRVCGRVVKTDPVTGEKKGVPFATVHVEDTDCSFLGFFPVEGPFWWLWPYKCDREVVATVVTDECGYFCVNIPRWEIDRVLRIRKQRVCFQDLARPRLPELEVVPFPPPIDPIDPIGPIEGIAPIDPVPLRHFGARVESVTQPRLLPRIAPPIGPDAIERAARALPGKVELAQLGSPIGPFLLCRDVYTFEWELFTDVPDITFRVTQDVDGDGVEEVIYSEGWFDVRWNDTDIDDVELEASPSALATDLCDLGDPEGIPCGDEPAIVEVGRMPVSSGYLDANGYATRVNRPRTAGDHTLAPIDPAEAPFTGDLQLSGCYDVVDGGVYYRILDEFEGTETPITGVTWTVARTLSDWPPPTITMVPDSDGWYEIAEAKKQFTDTLMMSWPASKSGNGLHHLRVEIGNAAKSHLAFSDPVPLHVDHRAPDISLLSVRYAPIGGGGIPAIDWTTAEELLTETCPVLDRPTGQDVAVRVRWTASADHFRDAALVAFGCGATGTMTHSQWTGSPTTLTPPPPDGTAILGGPASLRRWHATTTESGLTRTDVFLLPASASQGAYGLNGAATTRAFSPAGSIGLAADWFVDPTVRHRTIQFRFAVINV